MSKSQKTIVQGIRKSGAQVRHHGPEILGNREMTIFWPNMPFPEGNANFSGPAGGRSLALAATLMAGTWLVETVLPYR